MSPPLHLARVADCQLPTVIAFTLCLTSKPYQSGSKIINTSLFIASIWSIIQPARVGTHDGAVLCQQRVLQARLGSRPGGCSQVVRLQPGPPAGIGRCDRDGPRGQDQHLWPDGAAQAAGRRQGLHGQGKPRGRRRLRHAGGRPAERGHGRAPPALRGRLQPAGRGALPHGGLPAGGVLPEEGAHHQREAPRARPRRHAQVLRRPGRFLLQASSPPRPALFPPHLFYFPHEFQPGSGPQLV
eukprot:scaffold132568_cov20-Prasinocladus_malaysianus.AAC.1